MSLAPSVDPGSPAPGEHALAVHRRRWWILGVLCLSLVVITLDNTILNVALPTLVRDLGATNRELQWLVDAYTIVFAGLLLTAGSLGDRFGRRGALSAGLAVFAGGSIVSTFATSAGHLVVTRAVMGAGAAFIMPATLSILTNVFPDDERGRAIGIWAAFSAVGIAIGPVAGGLLLEHFSWSSIFWVNVPVVAVALVAGRLLVPTSRDPAAPRIDLAGAALSIAGLGVLLYAIIEAPDRGWTDPATLVSFVIGVALLAVFALWERRVAEPMFDLSFFADARFSAASAGITLVFFALFGGTFLFTQYMQFVLGYSALETGVRLLPMAATLMVAAPLSARWVERWGTTRVVALGLATVAAGLALFLRTGVDTGYGPFVLALVVMAVGMGNTMAPATESIMGSLPRTKAGVGSAVNDTTRQVGGALGVAVVGSVFASLYAPTVLAAAPPGAPPEVVAAAGESVGAALAIGQRVGGPAGAALIDTARHAFVDAMHGAIVVAICAALAGALVTARWLPARARSRPDTARGA